MASGILPYVPFIGKLQSCLYLVHACMLGSGRQALQLTKYAGLLTYGTSRCSAKMRFFTLYFSAPPTPHAYTLLQPFSKTTQATDSLLDLAMGLLQNSWHCALRWDEGKCPFHSRDLEHWQCKLRYSLWPRKSSLACVFLTTAVGTCSCIPICTYWRYVCTISCSEVPFLLLMKRQFYVQTMSGTVYYELAAEI